MRISTYLISGLLSIASVGPASAQDYPSRPVTILVGLAPGGTVDTMGRLLANQLSEKWKQSVIVTNKPGAGGALVFREMVSKPADGYTIVVGATPSQLFWIRDTGFKYEDLKVVTLMGMSYYCLMVHNDVGVKSLGELIKLSKQPGKLSIGVIPTSAHEMAARQMQKILGLGGDIIPYKGIGQMFPELIAGTVKSVLIGYAPPLETGKVSALAVAGNQRWERLPNVPTFKELGFNFDPGAPFTVYVRAGTPDAIVNELSREAMALTKSAAFADKATKVFGIAPVGMPVRQSQEWMDNEMKEMKAIVDELGVKPQ